MRDQVIAKWSSKTQVLRFLEMVWSLPVLSIVVSLYLKTVELDFPLFMSWSDRESILINQAIIRHKSIEKHHIKNWPSSTAMVSMNWKVAWHIASFLADPPHSHYPSSSLNTPSLSRLWRWRCHILYRSPFIRLCDTSTVCSSTVELVVQGDVCWPFDFSLRRQGNTVDQGQNMSSHRRFVIEIITWVSFFLWQKVWVQC
jgi:hypothetical protein